MERTSFRQMNCSVAQTLEVVGEWWSMLIVRDAFFGVTHFDEFHSRLGISRNILQRRLTHLVDHGVLKRVQYQERPPRHEYKLTEKGRDLWHVLNAMREWGDRWAAPEGPRVELVHTRCGERTELVPTCEGCGEVIGVFDVHAVAGRALRDPELLAHVSASSPR
jgi:DNA-binding HxlR family transcriptional regulator